MAGEVPTSLGGQLPAPECLSGRTEDRRAEDQREKKWTCEAIKESTDEEYWNIANNNAHRPRDRHDARLRCSAPSGLRRADQARTGQTVVTRAAGLDDARLRDRSEGGRRLSLRVASYQRKRNGDGRRLPRNRGARAARQH